MTPEAALSDYYAAFGSLDIETIRPYFHEPAVLIAPAGVFPMADAAALTAMLDRVINDLRSRGYGRSEFLLEDFKALGSVSALATGIAVRYKTDGQELERLNLSYVMQRVGEVWKIAVMVVHG